MGDVSSPTPTLGFLKLIIDVPDSNILGVLIQTSGAGQGIGVIILQADAKSEPLGMSRLGQTTFYGGYKFRFAVGGDGDENRILVVKGFLKLVNCRMLVDQPE